MNEYPKQSYGAWSGLPNGRPFNSKRCAAEVRWVYGQCCRRPGHGDRALFCKQHAKRRPAKEPK